MYQLHTTDALVLASTPEGEANRVCALLTRDYGLVTVHAQGIRLERSKLRYALVHGALVRVTLVRGREVWRLTGAQALTAKWPTSGGSRAALCRVLYLARRLVRGEENLAPAFTALSEGLRALATLQDERRIETVELMLVARFLYVLGYLRVTPEISALITGTLWNEEQYAQAILFTRILVSSVNEALRESQL